MSVIRSARAYANNAVAYVAWTVDQPIPDCLGFEITRIYADGTERALAAWVAFEGQSNPDWLPETTSVWPVQKFTWRDLTVRQRRDEASLRPADPVVKYRIRPVARMRDDLQPIPAPAEAQYTGTPLPLGYLDQGIETANVKVTGDFGEVQAAFNSGILSTQWLTHAMEKTLGHVPTKDDLKAEIVKLDSPIRSYLAGDLPAMMKSMFDRLQGGGELYLALYELTDPLLRQLIVNHAPQVHLILSNTSLDKKSDQWDTENDPARKALHSAGLAEMHDRMFNNSGHIGHNKFAVYVGPQGQPQAVLSGSTNWTENGLCAQSNNGYVAQHPGLAAQFLQYWNALRDDTRHFEQPDPTSAPTRNVQGEPLRSTNAEALPALTLSQGAVRLWKSPNTRQANKPSSNPALPPDLNEVYGFIRSAKQAIFFAVFLPSLKGATSIVQEAIDMGRKDTSLLVYGAISSPMAMPNYIGAQDRANGGDDNSGDAQDAHYQPSLFEENGVHIVRANALNAGDIVGNFERELLSAGNAIIHDKILVIDPLSEDDCVVVTGSHNLGYKASYANDDNLVIVRRNPALAQAYMVHVLDLYEHYRFRGVQAELKHDGKRPWSGFLRTDASWQKPTSMQAPSLPKYLGSD
ncbi:phospholipase D-like domain-containing protein [Cupriavidus basilensis]|uniref:phospholipase D n=1 Tax=Cupriavidus basilensis TaxID=68895 RepID=A0ABT6AFQ2_9BURK|nr:phospholipase D-like domain-containing protein [Cupriavidus basilensis]MDF3831426.1 phospholipase D-like domain-containing protein [Cupriavidus basilensis]